MQRVLLRLFKPGLGLNQDCAMFDPGFHTDDELALNQQFAQDQWIILPVENRAGLDRIQSRIAQLAARHLGDAEPADAKAYLDAIGGRVTPDRLNDLRLAVIQGIIAEPWFRRTYHSLAANVLACLVGNELVMQRSVGLSVQLPQDDSSLLPLHCDVWDGDSPYEVVAWLPLVDCYRTKSMCILPPAANARAYGLMKSFADRRVDDLFCHVESELTWLDVPYGHVLLFSQNLLHGNRINQEPTTRWTMNCRFKSLFSPYADKRLGEFFEPITLRAATRIGLDYRLPDGFDE
jgi:sporadic carbohydrate cluster 2OG-Fe(II) oxygenase